ncbi:SETD6 [Symbiodinium natans]|uniref:SETD6 protein n=1 Tax=Symbiodinium natans TaxID=878477 RepID=A0A812S9X8_9DINO|nr:SETD6 [Symbiodinium natans]
MALGSKVLNALFVGGAVLVAVYAWAVYGLLTEWLIPLGAVVAPEMEEMFRSEKAAIYIHALSSAVSLTIGPFQVIPSFRQKHMFGHRMAGRIYFLCCFMGSITGIILAFKAQGGAVGKAGFACLGVAWLISNLVGFAAIAFPAIRSVPVHERAMQISCALTYSAVTLRLYLPAAVLNPEHFQELYAGISWLCWIPNLVVVEIIRCCLKRQQEPSLHKEAPEAKEGL